MYVCTKYAHQIISVGMSPRQHDIFKYKKMLGEELDIECYKMEIVPIMETVPTMETLRSKEK